MTGLFYSFLLFFAFLGTIAFHLGPPFTTKRHSLEQVLLLGILLVVMLRFMLQPMMADRIYLAYYLVIVMLLIRQLPRRLPVLPKS